MKIIVRAPNWIGDCVMCLPAIRALKDKAVEDIILVCKEYAAPIFQEIQAISQIITIPDKLDIPGIFRAARQLRKYKLDGAAGLLFTNSFASALLFKLAGITKLTGYNKDCRGFLLDKKIRYPGQENKAHHIYFYLDLVAAHLGITLDREYPGDIIVSREEKEEAGRLLESTVGVNLTRPWLGISSLAAYGSAKQWLPERFAGLIERITKDAEGKYEILLFGTMKERQKIAQIMNLIAVPENETNQGPQVHQGIYNLAGKLNLRQTIAVLSMCRLCISNDSGLMHVASSLGMPLVAIFGPTLPHKTSPTSPSAQLLYHPVDCAPCLHRDCPTDHRCMVGITVDEVYEAVKRAL